MEDVTIEAGARLEDMADPEHRFRVSYDHRYSKWPIAKLATEGPAVAFMPKVTRSGDFSTKNATNLGYFPANNLQKFWTIFRQIAKVPKSDFGIFWNFLATSGETIW